MHEPRASEKDGLNGNGYRLHEPAPRLRMTRLPRTTRRRQQARQRPDQEWTYL